MQEGDRLKVKDYLAVVNVLQFKGSTLKTFEEKFLKPMPFLNDPKH